MRFKSRDQDIRIAPILSGSKQGGILQIILGIVLIAVGVFAGQPYLISFGISMALGGVVQLLSPQPKDAKSRDKPDNEPNYAFNSPVNTQAQGHCVPVAYGRPWCGSAVVSAGIIVGEDVYAPIVGGNQSIAQGLLAALANWWTFDNTLATSVVGGHDFSQTYAGVVTYEPGLKNEQLIPKQAMRANSDLASDASWSLFFWLDMSGGVVPQEIEIGVGVATTFDCNYHAALFVSADATMGGAFIRTAGDAGAEQGVYQTLPAGGRLPVALSWDFATLTYRCHINGILFATEVLADAPPTGCVAAAVIRNTGGAAFDVMRSVDEMCAFTNHCFTPEEIAYLGTGRSYAELLADAASGATSGQGGEGDDSWADVVEGALP